MQRKDQVIQWLDKKIDLALNDQSETPENKRLLLEVLFKIKDNTRYLSYPDHKDILKLIDECAPLDENNKYKLSFLTQMIKEVARNLSKTDGTEWLTNDDIEDKLACQFDIAVAKTSYFYDRNGILIRRGCVWSHGNTIPFKTKDLTAQKSNSIVFEDSWEDNGFKFILTCKKN